MELQAVHAPEFFGQIEGGKGIGMKIAVIGEVVNGKDGRWALWVQRQQRRDQAALPVVAVNDIGLPRQSGLVECNGGHGLGKGGKTFGVVGPILAFNIEIGTTATIEVLR